MWNRGDLRKSKNIKKPQGDRETEEEKDVIKRMSPSQTNQTAEQTVKTTYGYMRTGFTFSSNIASKNILQALIMDSACLKSSLKLLNASFAF